MAAFMFVPPYKVSRPQRVDVGSGGADQWTATTSFERSSWLTSLIKTFVYCSEVGWVSPLAKILVQKEMCFPFIAVISFQ